MTDPGNRSPNHMGSHHRVVDPITQVELIVPAGISAERAIRHARMAREGSFREIRFSAEWTHCYPL